MVRTARRRLGLLGIGVTVVMLLTGTTTYAVGRGGGATRLFPADSAAAAPAAAVTAQKPYLTAVAKSGRYFVDQYGQPFLVRGDSPWSALTDLSPNQMQTWTINREQHGFNAALISLLGATDNGAPSDDGATYDGIRPFVGGDVTRWNDAYWNRAHDYLRQAADHGITVMLYPLDGWVVGHSFNPTSTAQCQTYGAMVGKRFADLPNIVWMTGGDYFPATNEPIVGSDTDHCFDAMKTGIRSVGDKRPFSIQLGYQKSISTDNPYWASRVDWNFVYTYYPTYRAVLEAYARTPTKPALLGEANYEGENNQADTPDTNNETLRRQLLWTLTSGGAGSFYGSNDWEFLPGWENRLDTPAVAQLQRLQNLAASARWWDLVPDANQTLVTAGRGTRILDDQALDVLQSDYVTAAATTDGTLAVVYSPTDHTFTVNRSKLAAGVHAYWVDPASTAIREVPVADRFTTPGANSNGGHDWLLVLMK